MANERPPDAQGSTAPPIDTTDQARPKPSNGSLLAFFKGKPRADAGSAACSGDEGGSTTSAVPSAGPVIKQPPRKRRRKGDEGQARLMKGEGGGWAFGKADAPPAAVQEGGAGRNDVNDTEYTADTVGSAAAAAPTTAKRKPGRKQPDGEEAEVKDMAQKTRRTTAKRGRRKGGTGARSGNEDARTSDEEPMERELQSQLRTDRGRGAC